MNGAALALCGSCAILALLGAAVRPILRVDTYTCHTCSDCQARLVCRTRAIVQYERGDLPAIDASRCLGCLICILACPFGAVQKAGGPPGAPPVQKRSEPVSVP